jgi:hypothetical protein
MEFHAFAPLEALPRMRPIAFLSGVLLPLTGPTINSSHTLKVPRSHLHVLPVLPAASEDPAALTAAADAADAAAGMPYTPDRPPGTNDSGMEGSPLNNDGLYGARFSTEI